MTYIGGKAQSGTYQKIINQIPPHRVYIEPFLGAGAILRYKRPAMASIAIDRDTAVIQAFDTQVPNLQLICANSLDWLETYGPGLGPDTFIYLDPPYLLSTRKNRQYYLYELTDSDHSRLLEIIRGLGCMIAISGYHSRLYATALADWRTITYNAVTRSGRVAREWVWMNYPVPFELHDYRYLGDNFRERERIKRKQARWINRLHNMSTVERYAMLGVLSELKIPTPDIAILANHAICDDDYRHPSLLSTIGSAIATNDDTPDRAARAAPAINDDAPANLVVSPDRMIPADSADNNDAAGWAQMELFK